MLITGKVTDRKPFSWLKKDGSGERIHKQRVGLRLAESGERVEVILPAEPELQLDVTATVDVQLRDAVFANHHIPQPERVAA